MKHTSLFILFALSLSNFAFAQTDSLSVKPLVVDSIPQSYQWTVRSPLSAEERQRQADAQKELEDMKQRFRNFHHQNENTQNNEHPSHDDDFVWDQAEGSQLNKKSVTTEATPNRQENQEQTEALRMEIGRSFQQESLQQGKNTAKTPQTATQTRTNTNNSEWEDNAFRAEKPSTVDWQLKLGNSTASHSNTHFTKGQKIVLENLIFTEDGTAFSPHAQATLDQWLLLLQQNPGMKLEIGAHTHQGRAYMQAMELSSQRAQAVYQYWVSKGVSPEQLVFKGYGKSSPRVNEGNQEKNERIELIILELPNR